VRVSVDVSPLTIEEPPDLLARPGRDIVVAAPLAVVHVLVVGAAVVQTVLADGRAHPRAAVTFEQVVPGELPLRQGNRPVLGSVDEDAGDPAGAAAVVEAMVGPGNGRQRPERSRHVAPQVQREYRPRAEPGDV